MKKRVFRLALGCRRRHLQRRRFDACDAVAPDRERRFMIAFVLGSLAYDVREGRAEVGLADHPLAALIGDHVSNAVA